MISDCHNTDNDKLINVTSLPKTVLFYLCIVGEIGDPRTDGNHSADAVQGKMYRHFDIYAQYHDGNVCGIQGNATFNAHDRGVDDRQNTKYIHFLIFVMQCRCNTEVDNKHFMTRGHGQM